MLGFQLGYMILIPSDREQEVELVPLPPRIRQDGSTSPLLHEAEELQRQMYPILSLQHCQQDDTTIQQHQGENEESTRFLHIRSTLLWRPTHDRPGLVAYHLPHHDALATVPNLRATCLAMTCGQFPIRLYGHVLLNFMTAPGSTMSTKDDHGLLLKTLVDVLRAGAIESPDPRQWRPMDTSSQAFQQQKQVRDWILSAAQENYHDQETVQRWANITASQNQTSEISPRNDKEDVEEERTNTAVGRNITNDEQVPGTKHDSATKHFVTHEPLCLHCRGPTQNLCDQCQGAYFCKSPRDCRIKGWSHDCLCSTWKSYVKRREALASFPFETKWYEPLVSRECQINDQPYEDDFLTKQLGLLVENDSTWWATERHGWSGGASQSARQINPGRRVSYAEGFAPLRRGQYPPECVVPASEWKSLSNERGCGKNEAGLYYLNSWLDYYRLRNIPDSSPAALLLTFPLTLYYALVKYGAVPWTVSQMLDKPLRIDIVGAEKELNFLDLFQEVTFLLADQVPAGTASPFLELVFVVRKDMLPVSLVDQRSDGTYLVNFEVSQWLRIRVVEGTYGESVNPDLDCGSRIGPPSMVMAFNAGLYAYESWRSVLKYLNENQNVVGVMSDYNEWSGLQCASLGGSHETLCMNPFRQPRAMPVCSMNLPQFCNGFIYAINPQELE